MPLRDTGAHGEWVAREQPSRTARLAVAEFLVRLGAAPWAAPSVPHEDLCERPVYEVRSVYVAVPGEPAVWVLYRHTFDGTVVDLIGVTQGNRQGP